MQRGLSTIRHLKLSQLFYLLKYRLQSVKILSYISFSGDIKKQLHLIPLQDDKKLITKNGKEYRVNILNIEKIFTNNIIWSDEEQGRLWNYNLQYADFLKQPDLSVSVKEDLITDLYQNLLDGSITLEPYPASQRIMNTIRYLSENKQEISDFTHLKNCIHSELHFLNRHLEYHISGNHLLENGFALLMGGAFFQSDAWTNTAKTLLQNELDEQILSDGAHYERSVMYHKLLLYRILESIYYIEENSYFKRYLSNLASQMFSWLKQMTFTKGKIAHFNDSTHGVALSNSALFELASLCSVNTSVNLPIKQSGFRKYELNNFELICDVDGIEPPHQPGHAHADSLSFILAYDGKPFIVDPSISTYDELQTRTWERSTTAHNTITILDKNTAELWSSFRVGKRPKVCVQNESQNELKAALTFKRYSHSRIWKINSNQLYILDEVKGGNTFSGRLHLSPGTQIIKYDEHSMELSNSIFITFEGINDFKLFSYSFCRGFNKKENATGIKYHFSRKSRILIKPNGI